MDATHARDGQRHGSTLTVLAGGRDLVQSSIRDRWQGPEVQGALDSARAQFGHALCMCRPQPLKLQIRMRDGHYHLAVWPQEGPLHDTECAYFRDEISQGEFAPVPPSSTTPASSDKPHPDRVEFTLALAANAIGVNQISIKTLAMRLWDRASLCRWHPTWTRDWGRARYELQKAAGQLIINGAPCEELLFAPRPYRPAAQDGLNREWDAFVRSLVANPGATRLLVAPVRRIASNAAAASHAIHLRHLRQPIGVTQPCLDFLGRDCSAAVRACSARTRADQGDGEATGQPEVIGFFIVEGSSRGGVWARAGWLLPVHPRSFIPASNSNSMMLVDALIAQRYAFQHLLSEVTPMRRTGPDWLVRHVWGPTGNPVSRASMEILDRGSSTELQQLRAAIARRMEAAGVPTWTWVPHGPRESRTVPPLPPHDGEPRERAGRIMADLQATTHAEYRFGASRKFAPAVAPG